MKVRTVLVGLGLVGLALAASRVKAQSRHTRQVAVALVDSLSTPDVRAEILRFSDPLRPDIILLSRESAGPSDLAEAIAAYRTSVTRKPTKPGLVDRIALLMRAARPKAADRHRARAAEMLARVRREPLSRIGKYGRGRWATFTLRVVG